jgi:hypothetical protein
LLIIKGNENRKVGFKMPYLKKQLVIIIAVVALATIFNGCKPTTRPSGKQNSSVPQPQAFSMGSTKNEQPVAPEANPIGDIPDNQVFVTYSSTSGGYQIRVPEGWARTTNGTDASFVDKYDGVSVAITTMAPTLSLDQVGIVQAVALKKSGKAVQVKQVAHVKITSGLAILQTYESNSAPDPVTNKEVRLENNCYLISTKGKLAVVTLWAPLGADNVDQWNLIANSFGWL